MPNTIIKSFSKKSGKSIQEVEKLWDKAKALAKEKMPEDDEKFYAYVTSILKNMLSINEGVFEKFKHLLKESKKKVFLGGTCNNSTWRQELIPLLKIDYFDPVVDDWTEEAQKEEIKQRELCDYCLYVITSKMTGVYSIAEVIDDSNKHPQNTVFCVLEKGFSEQQIKSLKQVGKMVQENGGKYFTSLKSVAEYLNKG